MPERDLIPDDERPEAWPPSPDRSAGPQARRVWFKIGAIGAGLLPLLLLELGLRLGNLGRPSASPDPSAGFNRNVPLFEQEGAVFRTARGRAPFVAPQEFPVKKPANGSRIFCFGGSTVYGHPYLGETAFPRWLEMELAASDPARSWQVINAGGVSYASYRIVPLVQEVLAYQPDLIILATGHNEFLEDRTYQTLKERSALWAWLQRKISALHTVGLARQWLSPDTVLSPRRDRTTSPRPHLDPNASTRLDTASGYASYRRDDEWHRRVVAQFDESVRSILAHCEAAKIPIILVGLGTNLRDCPPFKSEHRLNLGPEPEADWQAAFDLATAAEKFDLPRALQFYSEAAAIDGEHALLNYRIGRVLDRLNRSAEALTYFQRAKDQDICPLRIVKPLQQVLARVVAETHVPWVDAEQLLADRSPNHLPGYDWYVDHVHPTIAGHQIIARALAGQMQARSFWVPASVWGEGQREHAYARHLDELGPGYFADGNRRVGWLENWAQRQRLAAELKPNDAPGFARLGFRHLDLGEDDAAWAALSEALHRDPAIRTLITQRAQALRSAGRSDRAATLLQKFD
jgi:tetratricopeptide (TPR) repeat protein